MTEVYMNRIIIFIIGLIMSTIGLSYIIIYLNVLAMGYSFVDYLNYIFTKVECIIFFIGYLLMFLSIYLKRRKKDELHV